MPTDLNDDQVLKLSKAITDLRVADDDVKRTESAVADAKAKRDRLAKRVEALRAGEDPDAKVVTDGKPAAKPVSVPVLPNAKA